MVARCEPLLQALSSKVFRMSERPGDAARTKLVNNYVAITLTQVNAEALALSQRFGLDLVKTMEVLLGTSANNGQLRMNLPNKVLAGDTTPGFTVDLAHKDLSLVVNSAHNAKVPMPVAAAVHESYSMARARGALAPLSARRGFVRFRALGFRGAGRPASHTRASRCRRR